MKRLIRSILLILACFFLFPVCALAKTEIPHDYVLDNEENERQPIPLTHECTGVIGVIEGYEPESGDSGHLKAPTDLFIDSADNIYISDTGNNTVLKLSPEGQLLCTITEADGIPLNYPMGVFVDEYGDIFIADNRNQRILHMSGTGDYIESFVAPESELLSQELTVFDPAQIAVNPTSGYLYMLLGKQFLTLDARNHFRGLTGSELVGFDLFDFFFRIFGSERQQMIVGKRQPASYINFCVTPDNEIYAVSLSEKNQIKRINSIGNNTYPTGFYGEMSYDEKNRAVYPAFVDIAVNSYGMVTVADKNSSRLYQYDREGNLLASFGGKGTNRGTFHQISALAYDSKDRLFILDASSGSIQILTPTTFLDKVQKATKLYQEGHYSEALVIWKEVNQTATNYPNAKLSIAKILYKQKEYTAALQEYYQADNATGYGTVMEALRFEIYSENFGWVLLVFFVFVGGSLVLLVYLKRKSAGAEVLLYETQVSRGKEFGRLSLIMLFHPVRALAVLKHGRRRINLLPILLMPLLLIAVRLVAVYGNSFTVASMRPQEANLLFEIAIVLIPYVLLGFSLYLITSILSGEMTLYETFASLAYSLLPMTIAWPILTAISQIVATSEVAIFHSTQIVLYVWTAILVLLSVQQLNDFTFRKTIGVMLLSLLGVAIILVVALLLFALTSQFAYFFIEVINETKNLRLP